MKPIQSKSETGTVSETGYGQLRYVSLNFGFEYGVAALSLFLSRNPQHSLLSCKAFIFENYFFLEIVRLREFVYVHAISVQVSTSKTVEFGSF